MSSFRKSRAAAVHAMAAIAVLLAIPDPATARPAEVRGLWEPVNYSEDLRFMDVFFVTPTVGYVSGAAGTILKTADAGATWTPQLGGDPNSGEAPIERLLFVTEHAGWAVQVMSTHANLLRTQDGETWEPIGTIEEHYADLAFTSGQDGVYTHNQKVYRTHDGGRNWSHASDCRVRGQVDGLPRQIDCQIMRMHFPAPSVGYAVAYGDGAAWMLRTDDGGTSWHAVTPIPDENGRSSAIFFTDEYTGYVRVHSGKAYRTQDGGQTWTLMIANSLGERIRFADPQVGWSFANLCVGMGCENAKLSYTTDGGKSWASRSIPLPAGVAAFSMPRRDIAYAAGEHGMIYRYRMPFGAEPAGAGAIVSVGMPPLDTEVFEQLAQLEAQLVEFDGAVEAAAAGFAEGDASFTSEEDAAQSVWLRLELADEFAPLEASVASLAAELPEIGSKHRNLNLVLAGLALLGDLTSGSEGLKQAFAALGEAQDLSSLSAALTDLHVRLDAVKTSVEEFHVNEGEF